ncbi:hypothetical protein ACOBQX_02335 [Actinokineospora sp. G85]
MADHTPEESLVSGSLWARPAVVELIRSSGSNVLSITTWAGEPGPM